MDKQPHIHVVGARVHNLKNISVNIPRSALTVITGVSGSGKSSLAFDTIHAEGQRRYIESLSVHARQLLEQLQRPDVDRIDGLSPTIAIEQRMSSPGPRATVATTTEIHDYLRVLFARVGQPHCLICQEHIAPRTITQIVADILRGAEGRRALILAPLPVARGGNHEALLTRLVKDGFVRARIDGVVVMLEEAAPLVSSGHPTIEAVVDRLVLKESVVVRAAESVELAARLGSGRVIVSQETAPDIWIDHIYSTVHCCPQHPAVRIDALSPQLFSFNSPQGACPTCTGLGCTLEFDPELVIPDRQRSLADGAVTAWRRHGQRRNEPYAQLIADFSRQVRVSPDVPVSQLPESAMRILLHGSSGDDVSRLGVSFEGVLPNLRRLWEGAKTEALKERLHGFLSETPCAACGGSRLRPEALCVRVHERNMADICRMNMAQAVQYFNELRFSGEAAAIADPLLGDLRQRLRFLCEVGVEYLTLERGSATLSGGEWQRLRLATQIGGGLSGICYVLDEPTIGLHPRDSRKLADILRRLAALENTVVVVEHDPEMIETADYLIDVGPGAGASGGHIVAKGTPQAVRDDLASLTGRYLSGRMSISIPKRRRPVDANRLLTLRGVTANNLKNVTIQIPLGVLICVTGVSGSGKSTLVSQVLVRVLRRQLTEGGPRPGAYASLEGGELVDQLVEIQQTPLGRSPRGNPATYAGILPLVRELFARSREAKVRGYGPNRFSFNNKGGRCEQCAGRGTKRVAMHFLPDVFVPCGECSGRRYNRETLEIRFRGKNIADVLDMSVDAAAIFFENFEHLKKRLELLQEVGLGYVALGQSMTTLSGGEAQRLKLGAELQRGGAGHTLYVLDEPTMGLHFADVSRLVIILQRLVDRGDTVLCIEHNLDVIKCADWVIDLGPEGGDGGGMVVVDGMPEAVAEIEGSHTGRFLKRALMAQEVTLAP